MFKFFKNSCIDLVDLKPTQWTLCHGYLFFLFCCCGECLGGDCICFVCFFISRTVDSNVARHEGREDDLEECDEVQGQIANQGKPPLLVAYLDPSFIYASLSILFIYSKMHCFL
jgi:hypothetical protein